MPLCPIYAGVIVTGPCKMVSCYNNVPSLDYRCLKMHGDIYNKSTSDILYNLYGKGYKMTSAMAIKAARVAFTMKDLEPEPNRPILGFEGNWVSRIKKAGPLNSKHHWSEITKRNSEYLFADRMLQVLNTMEASEYGLGSLISFYVAIFSRLDLSAFALSDSDKAEVDKLMRSRL